MARRLFAVLVHCHSHQFELLQAALERFPVDICSVNDCTKARHLISQTEPHLVFSDLLLRDETWVDVVNEAESAAVPIAVIVVGAREDERFRTSALARGAFAYLAPPFELQHLEAVLGSAERDIRERRRALALAAVPWNA